MRKSVILLIAIYWILLGVQSVWAEVPFKFPKRIKFKLLKKNSIWGTCVFFYEEKTDKNGLSMLKMRNFQGLGFTTQELLVTYILTNDSSMYASFIMKGRETVTEIRVKEVLGFDLKKEQVLMYKDESNLGIEIPFNTKYPVTDILSSFFVTSKLVALRNYKKTEKFNFLLGKRTKIAKMRYMGCQKVPFREKEVFTDILAITINGVEMFRMNIFKDQDGYCFPVSVTVSDGTETFEMRADKISKI